MIQTQQQLSASHLMTLTLEKQRGIRTTFSEKHTFPISIGSSSSLSASPLQDVFFQGLRVDSPQGKLPASKIAQNKLIDDDIYQLIRAMPKVDLHEHQSGSSDLAVLKTALISKGQMKDLDWEQLREAYRVTRDINFVKNTISSANIGEDGSVNTPPAPVDSMGSREVRRKDLESYRKTSEKINPLVKNPPFAYLSAHMFALEAVQENVRYVEYRLSPEGQGGTPEEIIALVEEGFQDANHRLEKNRKRFDYGLIVLLTRHGDETLNPKTGHKVKVDKAIELAQKTVEMKKKGYPIVGIDLATDELHCPVTEFAPAFQVIKDYNKTCPLK
ncbi:MAG: hypothetical protein K2X66_17410, partial [Cyanobacteria bacterium]|nr:hypothetical protein [Cyanobacteriota bacterium]